MIEGKVYHKGLRALLEFESTRHGQPVEYCEASHLSVNGTRFRPRIEVNTYCGSQISTVDLPMDGVTLAYNGPWASLEGACDTEVRLGATDDDKGVLVAGVTGNRLLVFLSLGELFRQVEVQHVEDPDKSPWPNGNPAHRVFEAIFSQAMPVLVSNTESYDWRRESEEYVRMKLAVIDRSVTDWREEILGNERGIEDKTFEVMGLVTRNQRLRESLKVFEEKTRMELRRRAAEEHAAFVSLMKSGAVSDVEVSDSSILFTTGTAVIEFEGYRYEFGPFRVELGLADARVMIHPTEDAHQENGYFHPHVSDSGKPCLGNTAPIIAKALGMGDVTGAVTTVLEYLRSYNPHDAYQRIERWDPDWEDDDDRFESCYDNASSHDCAVCSEDGCPFRDGAEARCYEHQELSDCIECGDCGYRETAMSACHEDRGPQACMECDQGCDWAGSEQACHDSHEGELCKDCTVESCRFHLDEEAEPEPVAAAGGA